MDVCVCKIKNTTNIYNRNVSQYAHIWNKRVPRQEDSIFATSLRMYNKVNGLQNSSNIAKGRLGQVNNRYQQPPGLSQYTSEKGSTDFTVDNNLQNAPQRPFSSYQHLFRSRHGISYNKEQADFEMGLRYYITKETDKTREQQWSSITASTSFSSKARVDQTQLSFQDNSSRTKQSQAKSQINTMQKKFNIISRQIFLSDKTSLDFPKYEDEFRRKEYGTLRALRKGAYGDNDLNTLKWQMSLKI